MPTTMWEVQAVDGRLQELLAWVLHRVDDQAQVYRSADPDARVVVIDQSGSAATVLADVPEHLVARPPGSWDFELVGNG
jgi:hypothetical protein